MSPDHNPLPTPATPNEGPPPAPRWVKVLALAVVALVVLAVLAMHLIGGEHGPGRHLSVGDAASHADVAAGRS